MNARTISPFAQYEPALRKQNAPAATGAAKDDTRLQPDESIPPVQKASNTPAVAWGATPEDWTHFDLVLGLGDNLLPIVSNPGRPVAPGSSLNGKVGKVPSCINRGGLVVGMAAWTERTITPEDLRHWASDPDIGIGLRCRVVRGLDADIDDPKAAQKVREAIIGHLGYTPPVRGREGSAKFLMPFVVEHDAEIPKVVIKTAGGNIEMLGDRQQFVVAGTHPKGKRYAWEGGLPAAIPRVTYEEWVALRAMLEAQFSTEETSEGVVKRAGSGNGVAPKDDPVGDYLDKAGLTLAIGRDNKRHIRCVNAEAHSMGEDGDGSTSYFPPNGEYQGHFKCLHASCQDIPDGDFLWGTGYMESLDFAPVEASPNDPPPLPSYTRDKQGRVEATKENVILALRSTVHYGLQLRRDVFREETMIAPHATDEWRTFLDTDYTELCVRLEKGITGFKDISKERIREAVAYVADRNQFDSAGHWLGGLVWDGTRRVEQFLPDYFGAEDTPYHRAVGRYFWTALAGRVLVPGIKADMVPVAVGAQGAMKSSTVKACVPAEDFFLELNLEEEDKEIARKMRGKLVVELGELRGMRARDHEHLKGFITRTHDEWRPLYSENTRLYPRRSVFFGTTNRDDFLADDTGHRRWLPFRAGGCNPQGVIENRGQLWAEARDLFKADGIAWQQAEELARVEHEQFVEHDTWEPSITSWIESSTDKPHYLHLGVVIKCALGFDDKHITKAVELRAARVLKVLGYEPRNIRVSGKKTRVWVKP